MPRLLLVVLKAVATPYPAAASKIHIPLNHVHVLPFPACHHQRREAIPSGRPAGRFGLHFGEVLQCSLPGCPKPGLLDYARGRDERPGFGGVVGIFEDALLEKITDGSDDTEADLFIVAPHFTEAALIIAFFHELHPVVLSALVTSGAGCVFNRRRGGSDHPGLPTATHRSQR